MGILLAAGRGSRMGGRKMLRRLPEPDGRPLVVAAFGVLARACDAVVLVTAGDDAEEIVGRLGPPAAASGVSILPVSGDPATPMFGSIRRGLARAGAAWPGRPVLLHPGDIPRVRPATLRTIVEEAARTPDVAVLPETAAGGGHPVLVPASVAERLLALRDDHAGGLRAVWEHQPTWRRRIPVDDPGCRRDADTPEDLAAMGDVDGDVAGAPVRGSLTGDATGRGPACTR